MSRRDTVLQLLQRINDRDFDGVRALHTATSTFVAPGLDLDLSGRHAIVEEVRKAVEQGDLRYEIHDVIQRGPFVVAFLRSVGVIDGYPMGWELCTVHRFDGERIAETWAIRGTSPEPLA